MKTVASVDQQRMTTTRVRTRACIVCDRAFSYEIGRGKDRKHCSSDCRGAHKRALGIRRLSTLPKCEVEGCPKQAVRAGAGLCEACYVRRRRTGGVKDTRSPPVYRYRTHAGYIVRLQPGHPLATAEGRVLEHRQVAFAKCGGVCPACYWCCKKLEWASAVVDHLNDEKDDNRPDNLVVACNGCNRARGRIVNLVRVMDQKAFDAFVEAMKCSRACHDAKTAIEDGGFGRVPTQGGA